MDEFIGKIRCWKRCLDLMFIHSKMEVCNDFGDLMKVLKCFGSQSNERKEEDIVLHVVA